MTAPNVTATSTPTPNAAATSGVPTGTPAPTPTSPTGAQETGFKFTPAPGIPEWLVGKSAAEAAALANQLYAQNQRYMYQPQPQPVAQSYQPPVPQAPAFEQPKQEEWLSDPAGATKRYAEYLQQTQFAPQLQQQATIAAQTNRELVKLQRADEFRRWGPEIDMTLQQIAPNPANHTPQNIAAVVDMVKARHVDELIAEERAKYQNELGGAALRPTGASGGASGASQMALGSVDLDKLPPGYRDALRALNVTNSTIDEFLLRTVVRAGLEPDLDKARERWTKQVMRGDIFSDNKTYESGIYA